MAAITRILSYAVNKPYRSQDIHYAPHPYINEDGYVDFAPGDIENPRNWSMARRITITMTAVLLVVNATFASSSPSGCFGSISKEFGISTEVAGLTITLFLLGYCAGPLIFAPLSEFYGRRWIFYISFAFYLSFNFLCAFAPNLGALLVGRFLAGTFVSAPLSNAPGVLADLWDPLQRANAMAGFSAMVYVGPALGPVIAGFLELKKDWRWSFYVLLWLGGLTAILMLTIPETYAPTILYNKAKRIRKAKIPAYENVKAEVEDSDRTLVGIYKVALTRPWIILFDPISLLCAIYMAVVYTLLYMLFTIYPIVFQEKRGWNSGVGELPLVGTVVGALIGGLVVLIDTRLRQRKIERGEKKMEDNVPEDRLILAMIGGIVFPATMFWFAWSAEYNSVHWIVPTLAGCFLSSSLLLIFVAYLNYLVDCYLMYAASAIAANTIARSACGAAAPLFTNQMFSALGVGGGGSLIGGVASLLAVIPFLFYKYGKQIRFRSRFAPGQDARRQEKSDEEAVPPGAGIQSSISPSDESETSISEASENAEVESGEKVRD
ncbi:Major facilitator superfamily domain, general substrate transporter [Penicillium italicum]|uniref:Major facilitator superfamily domain, general substrate transporter n=1 Tax=Penicillium italicum TaxID=40296 RepID=A0A0A2KYZ9_PENIT|nr:Major facilitator superfamily domain, general substrate transporter [Penicillium italicum]